MTDHPKYFVTFNSDDDDYRYPGIGIFDHTNTCVHNWSGFNYPNTTRASAIYMDGGKYKIRAVTSKGNLYEIDPFIPAPNEKKLDGKWGNCDSISRYRDCTILINNHVFLVNPDGIQKELPAGGDWHKNLSCCCVGNSMYVLSHASGEGTLYVLTLDGWDGAVKTHKLDLGETLNSPMFLAVNPLNGELYIAAKKLYRWKANELHDLAITTEDASTGGFTVDDKGNAHLWYEMDGTVWHVDFTGKKEPTRHSGLKAVDTERKSNGMGLL